MIKKRLGFAKNNRELPELQRKKYKYMNPGIGKFPYAQRTLCMEVIDPFGNRITFTGPK